MSGSTPTSREQIVTILAIDMVDFAVLSERMPPDQAFRLLQGQLATVTKAIESFDGKVDHFYGDGLLAYFTGEMETDDGKPSQTDRALMCSEQLQHTFVDQAAKRTPSESEPLESAAQVPLRIGINTANMYLGQIPSVAQDLILVGPGLHHARRLAGNCEPCKIMLGSSSLDFLRKVDRIKSPIKRRYVQMQTHGEVVMAYEYNPFEGSQQKLGELMRQHMSLVDVERREERWPSPMGVLSLEFDAGPGIVRNFSLRGFAFDSGRYLAPGINLAAKVVPRNEDLHEDLRDLDLHNLTLEVRWGYPLDDKTFRHGVQIKNLSTNQCLQLNNLLRRTIHNKSA